MDEARVEDTKYGRGPVTDGWFVVNVRDAAWMHSPKFGSACVIETDEVSFPQIGYTIAVLQEGGSSGLYHREDDQEDFLVLSGECIAIVEGEERRLRAWDFLHCPPGTEHIVVGAGPEPCVIFMAGAREHRGTTVYLRNEVALRHGVSVETDTDSGREAYAPFPATVYLRNEVALRHGVSVETDTDSGREAYAPFPGWEPGAPESSRRPFA